jgi:archaemetzincin
MTAVRIVRIEPVDRTILQRLIGTLAHSLQSTVRLDESNRIDPAPTFDVARSQYNSTALIATLLERFGGTDDKILGVTALDLFVPVLTFVFGEAQLKGKVAVVSTRRLDDVFYGLPPNRDLFESRLLRESVHELGHTFGLIHCPDYQCVMHSSTSVEEIDLKGSDLCSECRAKIAGTTSAS